MVSADSELRDKIKATVAEHLIETHVRKAIAVTPEMIEQYFHRDAENFRWDIHDPVEVGDRG